MVLKRRLFENVYEHNFMDLNEKECLNVDPNTILKKRKKQRHKAHLVPEVHVEDGVNSEVNLKSSNWSHETIVTGNGEQSEISDNMCNWRDEENKNLFSHKDSLKLNHKKHKHKHKKREAASGASRTLQEVPATANEESAGISYKENKNMYTQKDSSYLKWKKHKHKEREVNTERNRTSHEISPAANGEESGISNEEIKNMCIQTGSSHLNRKKHKHVESNATCLAQSNQEFTCPTCFKNFDDRIDFINHLLLHREENLFSCTSRKKLHRKDRLASEAAVVHGKESKVHTRNDHLGNYKDEENKNLYQKKQKHKKSNVNTRNGMASHEISVPASVAQLESVSEEKNNLCTQKDSLYLKWKKHKHKHKASKIKTAQSTASQEKPVISSREELESCDQENKNVCTRENSSHIKRKEQKNRESKHVTHEIPVTADEKPESSNQENKNMCIEEDSLHLKRQKQKHKDRKVNIGDSMAPHEVPGTANGEQEASGNEDNYYLITQKDSLQVKQKKKKKKERQVNTEESIVSHEILETINEERPERSIEEEMNMCTEDGLHLKQQKQKHKDRKINIGHGMASHEVLGIASGEQEESRNEENYYLSTTKDSLQVKQKKKKKKECKVNTEESIVSHEILVSRNEQRPESGIEEDKNMQHLKQQKHKDRKVNTGDGMASQKIPGTANGEEEEEESVNEENYYLSTQKDSLQVKQKKKKKKKEHKVNTGVSIVSHKILMTTNEEQPESYNGENENMCTEEDSLILKQKNQKQKEREVNTADSIVSHETPVTLSVEVQDSCIEEIKNMPIQKDSRHVTQKKQKREDSQVNTGDSMLSHEVAVATLVPELDQSNEGNKNMCTQEHIWNLNLEKHEERHGNSGNCRMSQEITVSAHEGEPDRNNEENDNECAQTCILNLDQENNEECYVNSGSSEMSHEIPVTVEKEEESESSYKGSQQNLCMKKDISDLKLIEHKHKESKAIYLARLLQESLLITQSEHEFTCPTCFKNFGNRSNFVRHLLIHRDVKDFSCTVCEKSFRTKRSLQLHMRTHTKEKPQEKQKNKEGEVTTGISRTSHEIPVTLEKKEESESSNKDNKQNLCTQKDISDLKLIDHKESKPIYLARLLHKSLFITKSEHEFSCPTCFKNFNNRSNFMRHLLIHKDVKDFSCAVCEKSFRTKQSLQVHVRIHMKEKPFKCTKCSACFSDANNLRRHVLVHNKGKQFVCAACSKAFAMKHHLEKHILSHEDAKSFPCPHCSKVFNYEYRLRIHLNTCRKLNPIICSICSKEFPRVYNLNRHMSTHK